MSSMEDKSVFISVKRRLEIVLLWKATGPVKTLVSGHILNLQAQFFLRK